MDKTYRVCIRGVKEGFARDGVVGALVPLFRRTEQEVRQFLDAPSTAVKRGVDLATAQKYAQALEQRGCLCSIESDSAPTPDTMPVPADYTPIKLRPFVSETCGVVLFAPESWQEDGTGSPFRIVDPATGAQFSAITQAASGLPLSQWAEIQFTEAVRENPFLQQLGPAREWNGISRSGMLAEFGGSCRQHGGQCRHLVLCLKDDSTTAVVVSITAPADVFATREALYCWLLDTQLAVFDVDKVRLAEHGDADAQLELALMYRDGPLPRDYRRAAEWLRTAAEQGHAGAQDWLGLIHCQGEGVEQSYGQAAVWWKKAAEQGHADSQNHLASLYRTGLGVRQNEQRARGWWRKAAAQGHREACAMLAEIDRQEKRVTEPERSTAAEIAAPSLVRVQTGSGFRWPERCAKCGSARKLTSAKAYISVSDSVRPTIFGGWKVKGRCLEIPYPVCERHQFPAIVTNMVTRLSPAFTLIRFCIYTAVALDLAILIGSVRRRSLPEVDLARPFTWICILGVLGLVAVVQSRKWAPLRLVRWDRDDDSIVDMVFADGHYAADFVSLNPNRADGFSKEDIRLDRKERAMAYVRRNWLLVAFFAIMFAILIFGH